jgi:hypothetical protein
VALSSCKILQQEKARKWTERIQLIYISCGTRSPAWNQQNESSTRSHPSNTVLYTRPTHCSCIRRPRCGNERVRTNHVWCKVFKILEVVLVLHGDDVAADCTESRPHDVGVCQAVPTVYIPCRRDLHNGQNNEAMAAGGIYV